MHTIIKTKVNKLFSYSTKKYTHTFTRLHTHTDTNDIGHLFVSFQQIQQISIFFKINI